MKALVKLSVLALTLGLTACQQTPIHQVPAPADPPPPTVRAQSGPPASAAAQTSSQTRSTAVITLHLAQEKEEQTLLAVDVGGATLYALPQPVLTQTDMQRVTPVSAQDNRSFILLEMSPDGMGKLRSITAQAQGHYLLLSVQGQLVSVSQISEEITDGRLLIGTQSPQHTQAIIRLMQGSQ